MREPQLAFAFRISLRIPSDGAALVEGASTGSQLPTDRQRRTATAEQNQRSRISHQQAGRREVFRVRTKAQRHPDLLSRPCSRLRQGRQVQSTAARPSSHFLTVLQSDNVFSLPRACLVRLDETLGNCVGSPRPSVFSTGGTGRRAFSFISRLSSLCLKPAAGRKIGMAVLFLDLR